MVAPKPKVDNDNSIENTRPINLLDVIMKGFWAIILTRIQHIWEDNQILHPMQFAFRRNQRIEAPVLLATMLSEKHNRNKVNLYACAQDVKKAYDTVYRHIGKEINLRRLGIPELIIDRLLEMDRENYTVVVTAYGLSDEILGQEGSFEMERGICQGSSESPDIWNAFYDILLHLQDDYIGLDDPEIQDPNGSSCEVIGSAFADDTFWISGSRQGMELRLNITALFLEFMGMSQNSKKSWMMGMEFDANGRHDIDGAT